MDSKADLDFIRELKAMAPSERYCDQTLGGEETRAQILGRGEMAFYQQGDRALLMEVLAGRGVIFAYSIRRWDDGKKVTPEAREVVIEMMSRVMNKLGFEDVKVVRK